jgi:hypothetical protein
MLNPRDMTSDELARLMVSDRGLTPGAVVTIHDARGWLADRLIARQAKLSDYRRFGFRIPDGDLAELEGWRAIEDRAPDVLAAVREVLGPARTEHTGQLPATTWEEQQAGMYGAYSAEDIQAMSPDEYRSFRSHFAWSGPVVHKARSEAQPVYPKAPVPTWAVRPADDGRALNYHPRRVGRPGENA